MRILKIPFVKRTCLFFAALFSRLFLGVYTKLLRVTISSENPSQLEEEGCIYAIWHDSLMAIPLLKEVVSKKGRKVHILISKSRDGDIPSSLVETYKDFTPLRVAHNARASALKMCVDALKAKDSIIITPDGPKGPRRELKGGSLYAAYASKCPIVPISVQWSRAYRLSSWDRFAIPLPFSEVHITVHAPVYMDSEDFSLIRQELQEKLGNASD